MKISNISQKRNQIVTENVSSSMEVNVKNEGRIEVAADTVSFDIQAAQTPNIEVKVEQPVFEVDRDKNKEISVVMTPGLVGKTGADGRDGLSPHIGANGNWFIGDFDTGVSAYPSGGSNLVFETEKDLEDWFFAEYERADGVLPEDLFIGQLIFLKEIDVPDYWVSILPAQTINDLSIQESDQSFDRTAVGDTTPESKFDIWIDTTDYENPQTPFGTMAYSPELDYVEDPGQVEQIEEEQVVDPGEIEQIEEPEVHDVGEVEQIEEETVIDPGEVEQIEEEEVQDIGTDSGIELPGGV